MKAELAEERRYPRNRYAGITLFASDQHDLPTYDYDELMVSSDVNGGAGRTITGFVAPDRFSYPRARDRYAPGWPKQAVQPTGTAWFSGVSRVLWIYNWWNNPVWFAHLSGSSVALNRIRTISGAAVGIGAKRWALLAYNPQDTFLSNAEWNLIFPVV